MRREFKSIPNPFRLQRIPGLGELIEIQINDANFNLLYRVNNLMKTHFGQTSEQLTLAAEAQRLRLIVSSWKSDVNLNLITEKLAISESY